MLATSATWGLAQSSTSFTSIPVPSSAVNFRASIGSERHLQPTPAGSLYADSAFAHGYRHGYEEGFHAADLDIHMGREPALNLSRSESKQAVHQYRSFFGSKQLFEQGFDAGFHSGYSDAMSGGEYHLNQRVHTAAAGLSSDVLPPTRRAHFDEGFAAGYASSQSPKAPGDGITTEYVEQYCRTTASGPYALDYCSGFARGYLLGMRRPATPAQSASLGQASSSSSSR
jgi:hypothetical protein